MPKEAVFKMKLKPKLHADFMAEAASEDRPAEQCSQAQEYAEYLQRKVEASRTSMRAGRGRPNDEVEAAFAAKRNQATAGLA